MEYVKSRKSLAEKGPPCSLTFLLLPGPFYLNFYEVYTTAIEITYSAGCYLGHED